MAKTNRPTPSPKKAKASKRKKTATPWGTAAARAREVDTSQSGLTICRNTSRILAGLDGSSEELWAMCGEKTLHRGTTKEKKLWSTYYYRGWEANAPTAGKNDIATWNRYFVDNSPSPWKCPDVLKDTRLSLFRLPNTGAATTLASNSLLGSSFSGTATSSNPRTPSKLAKQNTGEDVGEARKRSYKLQTSEETLAENIQTFYQFHVEMSDDSLQTIAAFMADCMDLPIQPPLDILRSMRRFGADVGSEMSIFQAAEWIRWLIANNLALDEDDGTDDIARLKAQLEITMSGDLDATLLANGSADLLARIGGVEEWRELTEEGARSSKSWRVSRQHI